MQLPVTPDLPIATPRLTLRAFAPDDLDALHAIQSDPEAVRYVPYGPRTRAKTAEVLAAKVTHIALAREGDLIDVAVATTDDGALIGDALLILRSVEHQTLEVGYIFARSAGGLGYATEAVRALVDLAFGALGARRVIARLDERNRPSAALLERLGFRLEARLVENEWFKGELSTELDYAVLAREWPVRPAVSPRPS